MSKSSDLNPIKFTSRKILPQGPDFLSTALAAQISPLVHKTILKKEKEDVIWNSSSSGEIWVDQLKLG